MSVFDRDILITNIKNLMSNTNTTQEKLAKALGMSQPNLSKALNPKDKKCFTVAQLVEIADHFNVSVDELVLGSELPLPIPIFVNTYAPSSYVWNT